VPLDALPPEIKLSFYTKLQSAEETAEMVAFCTAMQCSTERHSVSVLKAQRIHYGGADFRLFDLRESVRTLWYFCSLHIIRRDLVPERNFDITFRAPQDPFRLLNALE